MNKLYYNLNMYLHKYKYMKLIFTMFFSIFSILSCSFNKAKFCVNCVHFRYDFFDNKYSKCALFPVTYDNKDYLVDGRIIKPAIDYMYCSVVRSYDNKCGKNGNMYEQKKSKWYFIDNKTLKY